MKKSIIILIFFKKIINFYLLSEENRKKNFCEAENIALKQTIEKIKEGAIEVLIEKEKEILSLKMKLENFSLMKRTSSKYKNSKKFF